MNLNVFSEISSLKNVIIHSPIGEHQFLKKINTKELLDTKPNPDFLLFDKIVDSKVLIEEHQNMKLVLDNFEKSNTITFQDLLQDILENDKIKINLIKETIYSELLLYGNNNNLSNKSFKGLNSKEISKILITGYFKNIQVFKFPLPNLIFTRDIGAVIGKTLVTTWSWHKSRQRESIITRFIINYHPIFKNFDIFNFNQNFPNKSIEGGDINIFSEKIVCIGISQRTPFESIKLLLPTIFKNNFKYVYAIELPKKRKFMHLDCVFTKINYNECLVYPPLFINNSIKYNVYRFNSTLDYTKITSTEKSLQEIFKTDGYNLNFIGCGGKKLINQDKELLTMGANVFNLKPGIIMGYFQNKKTIKELEKYNYNIISSQDFCNKKNLKNNEKYFIYIDETQLSKGHGGIRCLTFPIERETINE